MPEERKCQQMLFIIQSGSHQYLSMVMVEGGAYCRVRFWGPLPVFLLPHMQVTGCNLGVSGWISRDQRWIKTLMSLEIKTKQDTFYACHFVYELITCIAIFKMLAY